MSTIKALVCAFSIAALAQPTLSLAQFPGGGGMRGGMGRIGGGMEGPGMGGSRGAPPGPDNAPAVRRFLSDEVDERLYMLQEDLRLTREQQPLWARYADAVRAGAKDVERGRVRNEVREKLPVLQRLDRLTEDSRNRLTALEDIAGSAKALVSVMSPAQRDICDPRLATIAALLLDSTQAAAPSPGQRRK